MLFFFFLFINKNKFSFTIQKKKKEQTIIHEMVCFSNNLRIQLSTFLENHDSSKIY